jgi:hypothetical protein
MDGKNNGFSIEIDEIHLNQIEDVYNSNMEVFVTLKDGFCLSIIVGTPMNLQYIMEKDEVNFYGPGLPWVIIRKLTKEIIQESIKAYMNDKGKANSYWLKLCYFATDIDMAVFDQLQAKEIAESAQFDLLINLNNLEDKINKLDDLNKSKKLDLVASLNKLRKDLKA